MPHEIERRKKTPEEIRHEIAVEKRLLSPHNVPTFQDAIQSVEIGFQHYIKPSFNHYAKRGPK